MKKLYFFIVIGWLFTVMSCKHQCPPFDKGVLSWIPYQENDVVELYSESSDLIIKFSIKSVVVSHQTQYQDYAKCGTCDDYIEITQNSSDNFVFYAGMSLHKNKKISQNYFMGDTPFYTYSEFKKYQFNGNEYDKVRVFESTNLNKTFKTLITVKGIGIIGLIDNEDHVWVLKNDKIKESKEGNGIIIHETSCG